MLVIISTPFDQHDNLIFLDFKKVLIYQSTDIFYQQLPNKFCEIENLRSVRHDVSDVLRPQCWSDESLKYPGSLLQLILLVNPGDSSLRRSNFPPPRPALASHPGGLFVLGHGGDHTFLSCVQHISTVQC